MATTTNYSWSTPDDTALVKDGAAAIRTLGSSVDTTVKNLNPETTLGDLAYRSSTANVKTRLGLGTAGQVLAVNSGATAPEWITVSSGGMTLISEQTASANSSLSFTSISGSYKQLLLVWSGIYHSGNGSVFAIRLNNSSTASAYQGSGLAANGSAFVAARSFDEPAIQIDNGSQWSAPFGQATNNSTSAVFTQANGQMLLDNYASSTKFKEYHLTYGYYNNSVPNYHSAKIDGVFKDTTAITSIDIVRMIGSDTFTNSTSTSIRLYGLS
jgi:hypothetical protein